MLEFAGREAMWEPFGGLERETFERVLAPHVSDWASAAPPFPLPPRAPPLRPALILLVNGDRPIAVGGAVVTEKGPRSVLRSIHPIVEFGSILSAKIDHWKTGEHGDVAAVECTVAGPRPGESSYPITFFNTHFAIDRERLIRGARYSVLIAAIVVVLDDEVEREIVIPTPRWAVNLPPERRPDGDVMRVDLSELTYWLPHPEVMDAATFRGRVEAVEPLGPLLLDTRGWRVAMTVIQDDHPFTLDFLVTDRVLAGRPLSLGTFLTGTAWVQGRLASGRPAVAPLP